MVYAMGGNANEILKSFHLSERSLTYDRVKSRSETQLWASTNIILNEHDL